MAALPNRAYSGLDGLWTARIKTVTPDAIVIDTPTVAPSGGDLRDSRIVGGCVQGLVIDGGNVANIGILFRRTYWSSVKNVVLQGFKN